MRFKVTGTVRVMLIPMKLYRVNGRLLSLENE
jgi:hypothetical protein